MLATGVVVDRWSYLPVFALSTAMPLAALATTLHFVRKTANGRPATLS